MCSAPRAEWTGKRQSAAAVELAGQAAEAKRDELGDCAYMKVLSQSLAVLGYRRDGKRRGTHAPLFLPVCLTLGRM